MMASLLLALLGSSAIESKSLNLDCQIFWADENALNRPDGAVDLSKPAADHKFTLNFADKYIELVKVEPSINNDDGRWIGKVSKGLFVFKRRKNKDEERITGNMIIKPIQGGYAVAWAHEKVFGEHIGFTSHARGRCRLTNAPLVIEAAQ